jgi:hypothetical protein
MGVYRAGFDLAKTERPPVASVDDDDDDDDDINLRPRDLPKGIRTC